MRWARELDGAPQSAQTLEVPVREMNEAAERVPPGELESLRIAAARITAFHQRQVRQSWVTVDDEGALLGQLVRPLERAGIYVPGGKAAYPSSVLMNAIPARVAGVGELVMCSPLSWEEPNHAVLAAARLAGVDRVFRVGGAQAVAAMAYGVGEVPAVDKIVGPGNAYVAAAKRLVFGDVDIDMIAGPSEILIVGDGSAPASWAASDLLAQAEHDEWASALLLTPSEQYGLQVLKELSRQLAASRRKSIAEAALEQFGGVIVTGDLEGALELASRIAPEHLELLVARPLEHLHQVRHAGAVFLGPWAPEAMGDYVAGPNHVLPTGGTARFSSALGVDDFLKRTSVVSLSESVLRRLGPHAMRLAHMEGLEAHGRSIGARLKGCPPRG
jgi:histidinol dehydrogenase